MSQLYLLVLTALYFLQISAWVPGLVGKPLFQLMIIPGLLIYLPAWVGQLSERSLKSYPISACVLALLGVVLASELVNSGKVESTVLFTKSVLFYLLLTGLIDTRERLSIYLQGFAGILFVQGLLVLLIHNGFLDIGNINSPETTIVKHEASGLRYGALGANFDANDTAALLVLGTLISLHFATVARPLLTRPLWLAMACVDIHVLQLTDSRGGFLALVVGLVVYLLSRWGKKGLIWGSCLLPIVVLQIATERMAGVTSAISGGTGQNRLQFWASTMAVFQEHPFLGLGPESFTSHGGRAVHNSFLQAFAELGFVGGTLFLGAFGYGFWRMLSFQRQCTPKDDTSKSTDRNTVAIVLTLVGSYTVAILALSHLYSMNTYVLFAIVTIVTRNVAAENSLPFSSLFARFCTLSVLFLLASKVMVVLLVRW